MHTAISVLRSNAPMKINKIDVRGFRNLQTLQLEPDPQINVIYGENAQGKTNFIEALWLFSGMKSFRGAKDAELVGFDSALNIEPLKSVTRAEVAQMLFNLLSEANLL